MQWYTQSVLRQAVEQSRSDSGIAVIMERPECAWITRDLESQAQAYAIASVVPEHIIEVRTRTVERIDKTEAAVKDRLTKEINYWDHRAEDLSA